MIPQAICTTHAHARPSTSHGDLSKRIDAAAHRARMTIFTLPAARNSFFFS
jgi:hypothetical protein